MQIPVLGYATRRFHVDLAVDRPPQRVKACNGFRNVKIKEEIS